MKYLRKIETIVTAMQFMGKESYYEALEFMGREKADKSDPEDTVMVDTPIGKKEAAYTDWIVKDEWGLFWVIGDGSFRYQYELKAED